MALMGISRIAIALLSIVIIAVAVGIIYYYTLLSPT